MATVDEVDETSDSELFERFPGVQLDHVNKHFYRGLLRRELRLNRCDDCGLWHHRPKPRCPGCLSKNVTPTLVSGSGTIYMLILLYQGPPADGVDYRTPHPVATVELDEQPGLRFTTAVAGPAGPDGEEMAIGDRVELDWIMRSGHPFPQWRKVSYGEGGQA